jgi:hypothetical protein
MRLISYTTNIRTIDITTSPRAFVRTLALTPEDEETIASRIRNGSPRTIARTARKDRGIGANPRGFEGNFLVAFKSWRN